MVQSLDKPTVEWQEYEPLASPPPHAIGRVALADGSNWDPDGDGAAELVISDGSTWTEVVSLGTL